MLSTVFILNRVRIFYLFFFHVPVLLLISVYGFHAASSTQEMKFNTFTAAVSLVRQKFNSALSFFLKILFYFIDFKMIMSGNFDWELNLRVSTVELYIDACLAFIQN